MNNSILYGGDDIGALVFDTGSHSFRVGYAQEDLPKGEIPSTICTCTDDGQKNSDTLDPEVRQDNNITSRKCFIDITTLCVPRKNAIVENFVKDGMIEDWDLFEKVLDFSYKHYIQSDPKFHPVLMTESATNIRSKRETLIELMFEKYNVPAFFLVKSAVLSAFASGRVTAMVVDSGASHSSAIPVHDGFVITNSVAKSPLGGDFLTMQCKQFLNDNEIDITPSYMIANKEIVKEKEKPIWTAKKNLPQVTPSWHNYMTKRVVQDFQHSVLQISESPYDEKVVSTLPACHYEFPNGYNQDFGIERFKISEMLFDPGEGFGGSILGIGNLVQTSIGMCDVDIRSQLFNSIVVAGGTSIITGFTERLNRDLSVRLPTNVRLKIIASSGSAERRFSSWIGGSILASIGTFQQMWISDQEYLEFGKGQIDRKCP